MIDLSISLFLLVLLIISRPGGASLTDMATIACTGDESSHG